MGQNSTEVAYQFGQFGSALSQLAGKTITAPEGHVIVAITFLDETSLSSLIAEDPTKHMNTAAAAHTGEFTRQVNQGSSTTNQIKFDDGSGNPISNATAGCQVGDHVYDSDGILHGVVVALDPNGNDTSEIQISNSVAIKNMVLLSL